MRLAILAVVLAILIVYTWKDWFIPLCALIVMTAVMKHESMPTNMGGIQGANPWNLLFFFVVLGWLADRLRRRERVMLPRAVLAVTIGYAAVIFVSFARGVMDVGSVKYSPDGDMTGMSALGFVSEYFINPMKYLAVAVLLCDGARTRRNMMLGIGALLAQAVVYGLQVIKYVPLSVLLIAGDSPFRYRIGRDAGLHANDMALVQVLGFWSAIACLSMWSHLKVWMRWGLVGASGIMLLALALCNSRGGFLAFLAVTIGLAVWRWRWMLAAMPVALIALCVAFPSIPSRVLVGIGVTDIGGQATDDWDAISAGRTTYLWPPALEQISKGPVAGFGRLAILRTPMHGKVVELAGLCPTHPHNAYIEQLLDSGIVGLLLTVAFLVLPPVLGLTVRRKADPLIRTAATIGLIGAGTILVMGVSGQTFYPREGIFLVLCAYGLMVQAYALNRAAATRSVLAPTPGPVRPAAAPVLFGRAPAPMGGWHGPILQGRRSE
jgi:O-antigen ligase